MESGAYVQVSAGNRHSCGVLASGGVQCWGVNTNGQLGNGAVGGDSATPVTVVGITGALGVSAGRGHSCTFDATGRAYCWGSNSNYQVRSSAVGINQPLPQLVAGAGVKAISVGGNQSCYIAGANDQLTCWGDNNGVNQVTPTAIAGFTGVTSVGVGDEHACVVKAGAVFCRGSNVNGRLGNNSVVASGNFVQAAGLGSGVLQVSAGYAHSCALLVGGSVQCWGYNQSSGLGDGTTIDRLAPVVVPTLTDAVAVSAGGGHTCARRSTGALSCWGSNGFGQLGSGGPAVSATPTPVVGITGATIVSAGDAHTCALRAPTGGGGGGAGAVLCWGYNVWGQLGDGAITQRSNPGAVAAPLTTEAIAVGVNHACVLSSAASGGRVSCWGATTLNRLGSPSPASLEFSGVPLPIADADILGATAISAGQSSSCALVAGGAAKCWGYNFYGQLGNSSFADAALPVAVSNLTLATQISVGGDFACVRVPIGSATTLGVQCWGRGGDGQLGNGSTNSSNFPREVTGLTGSALFGLGYPAQVSAGDRHACAVMANNQVKCWGAGFSGQLGSTLPGGSNIPVTVAGVGPATQVAAGGIHTCARLNSGFVQCWGGNAHGQLGDLTLPSSSAVVTVNGVSDAVMVAASLPSPAFGAGNTCALLASGRVQCWGNNLYGQVGNGTISATAPPSFVIGISTATAIGVGDGFACALLSDKSVQCWGRNTSGELGDGSARVNVPLPGNVLPALCSMDIDGDGEVRATTDGLLMSRALLGMSGTAVTNGALGVQATRRDWSAIRSYLLRTCGLAGLAP